MDTKYGNTNPVANCGKAHGAPDWVAFAIADNMIHGREGLLQEDAQGWIKQNLGPQHEVEFFQDLHAVAERVR